MSTLPRSVPVATFAGTVLIPESINVFAPPSDKDLRTLHAYLHDARVPVEIWKEIADEIGAAKVSEIKSIVSLLGAWLYILRWQWHETGGFLPCESSWAIACGRIAMRLPPLEKSEKVALSLFEMAL